MLFYFKFKLYLEHVALNNIKAALIDIFYINNETNNNLKGVLRQLSLCSFLQLYGAFQHLSARCFGFTTHK